MSVFAGNLKPLWSLSSTNAWKQRVKQTVDKMHRTEKSIPWILYSISFLLLCVSWDLSFLQLLLFKNPSSSCAASYQKADMQKHLVSEEVTTADVMIHRHGLMISINNSVYVHEDSYLHTETLAKWEWSSMLATLCDSTGTEMISFHLVVR